MKWKPEPEPPTAALQHPESTDIIDIDNDDLNSFKAGSKRSWVWNHLKDFSDPDFFICQVVTKMGNKCGKKLKKDKSSSTKNLHNHLLQFHCLADPKLTKKTKTNHYNISKWSQSGDMRPKPPLNSKNLKTVLVLLADCDLPFAFVERKSFCKIF
ncbi:uncharacterized protein VP01_889g5 [Puccinia sorghi]|uniref:BED-type domain-containing protein n=1 Tax=Puccinia sorghi TaxID=27349 RepID=A0A0L6UAA3_9BASI|nr:uncharacterized protein VP01_889g5 [Puccinia sorghi]